MLQQTIKPVFIFVLTVYALSTISWGIGIAHYYTCTPFTVWGWIMSPFSMGSPICQFMNYIQYELGKYYVAFWVSTAASIITYLK